MVGRLPALFCFACGRGINDDSRFCGYCGTSALAMGWHKVLRYDGVYVTKPEMNGGRISRQYFRFYPDRFVVGITFSGTSADVVTWWGRRCNDGQNGAYRVKGRDIEMACMGDAGALVFKGRIRKGGMTITSCNGSERRTLYRFVEGAEG